MQHVPGTARPPPSRRPPGSYADGDTVVRRPLCRQGFFSRQRLMMAVSALRPRFVKAAVAVAKAHGRPPWLLRYFNRPAGAVRALSGGSSRWSSRASKEAASLAAQQIDPGVHMGRLAGICQAGRAHFSAHSHHLAVRGAQGAAAGLMAVSLSSAVIKNRLGWRTAAPVRDLAQLGFRFTGPRGRERLFAAFVRWSVKQQSGTVARRVLAGVDHKHAASVLHRPFFQGM